MTLSDFAWTEGPDLFEWSGDLGNYEPINTLDGDDSVIIRVTSTTSGLFNSSSIDAGDGDDTLQIISTSFIRANTGLFPGNISLGTGDDKIIVQGNWGAGLYQDNINNISTINLGEGNDQIYSEGYGDNAFRFLYGEILGGNGDDKITTKCLTNQQGLQALYLNNSSIDLALNNDEIEVINGNIFLIDSTIFMGSGSDAIRCAGAIDGFNSSMDLGEGNDLIIAKSIGSNAGFSINGGAGIDTVETSSSYSLGANFERLKLTGTAAINGTGNTLNNLLTGNSGINTLTGGLGNDTYVIGAGDTVVEALNAGTDTVQSSIAYTLGANVENLTLTGTAGVNARGNSLNNVLTGNSGINILTGGLGNDTYVIGAGDIVVEAASAGTDTVKTSRSYSIATLANLENITLTGTAGVNATGNGSNNRLIGNGVANTFTGNAGADVITGGLGADVFKITALSHSRLASMDRITDFLIGTDKIDSVTAVTAASVKECGSVSTLDQAGISKVLTTTVFGANQAATFKFGTRTFLALNDATAGFNSTADGLIEITGYSGLLTNLAII